MQRGHNEGDEEENGLTGFVQEGVKKKWLKPATRRRHPRDAERRRATRDAPSSGSRPARPLPRTPSRTTPRTTTEVRRLQPAPKKCPPLATARAASAPVTGSAGTQAASSRSEEGEPQSPNPLGPLSLDEAVEIWVNMHGLASADDTRDKPGLILPSWVTHSIMETLWSYNGPDRVTLCLRSSNSCRGLWLLLAEPWRAPSNRRRDSGGGRKSHGPNASPGT